LNLETVISVAKATTSGASSAPSADLDRTESAFSPSARSSRSTFGDWAAETTNFANHIVEMALAHVVGDKVEAAYRRGELLEKTKELADVSKYCTSSPAGQTVCEEVVTLRGDGR
jgi:hypothetical protein